jgi:hypothetical protein
MSTVPSPANAPSRPVFRSGQYDVLYRAAATPFSSIAPSATWPSPSLLASGTELARTTRAWSLATAASADVCGPVRSGQPVPARHHAANDRSATWNPCACVMSSCSDGVSGSTAPSSTSARTRRGNSCAYHVPRYVP